MNISKIIYLLSFLFVIIFNNTSLANNIKNSAVVFMYHKFDTPKYPSTNIKAEQFEEHLNEFSKKKYNVISLNYIVDTIINDGLSASQYASATQEDVNGDIFYDALEIIGLSNDIFYV